MPTVSTSGRIAALSLVRATAAADQNAADRVCETGVLSGASHGRHELGQLLFNGSAKLAGTRSGFLSASLLVRSVDRVSRQLARPPAGPEPDNGAAHIVARAEAT